jgi:hypothetical protein
MALPPRRSTDLSVGCSLGRERLVFVMCVSPQASCQSHSPPFGPGSQSPDVSYVEGRWSPVLTCFSQNGIANPYLRSQVTDLNIM